MEQTDHATEGDPLKREDGGEAARAPTKPQKKTRKQVLGFSKITHLRTAIFFVSMFICLTILFAFSFILPCPERPQYLISWTKNFTNSGTYDFLAFEYINDDGLLDVLLVVTHDDDIKNKPCVTAGVSSPCILLTALDGADGDELWQRPLEAKFHWAQCEKQKDTRRSWICLLCHSDKLTAISKHNGDIIWTDHIVPSLQSASLFTSVPDLNEDMVTDVLLVASDNLQLQIVLISGENGTQIGSTVVLDLSRTTGHVLRRNINRSYDLLLYNDAGVYILGLRHIAKLAGLKKVLEQNQLPEKTNITENELTPLYLCEAVNVLEIPKTQPSDLLIVASNKVVMIDGSTLKPQWEFRVNSVLGNPVFIHFNKDNVVDIVLEDYAASGLKKLFILDGITSEILWYAELFNVPNAPSPESVLTLNSFSIVMFWGQIYYGANITESTKSERRSYWLHPLYPNVLLESPMFEAHIMSFRVTLLERGRHAAYFLLMGPEAGGEDGTVVLTKRKVKQDVVNSTKVVIQKAGPTEALEIKDAFQRLRFKDFLNPN